jgi:hypothetical protein
VYGLHAIVIRYAAGEEKDRAIRERGVDLQLVDELLEVAVAGSGLADGGEAVEYDEAGTVRSKLLPREVEQRLESALFDASKNVMSWRCCRSRV